MKFTESELKESLQAIEKNSFQLSAKDDLKELIPAMLEHIGSTDSILRDDLIYSALAEWISDENLIDNEQLRKILSVILDDKHMLYMLGEKDTDSIFTRSFSVLILPQLFNAQVNRQLFTDEEISRAKGKLLFFIANEKDRRGYVPGKGWAHAIAHAADALAELVICFKTDKESLMEILESIIDVICVSDQCYIHSEEERLVTVVLEVIKKRTISESKIHQWLETFSLNALAVKSFPERIIIRTNVKNFLQSLYFRLSWEGMLNNIGSEIDLTLRKISPFAHQVENN